MPSTLEPSYVRSVRRTEEGGGYLRGTGNPLCPLWWASCLHLWEPRATEDLDLLVLVQDLERCQTNLEPLGFVRYDEPMVFAHGQVTLQRLLKLEVGGKDHVVLDLLLVNSPGLDAIWQSRQSFEWEGKKNWIVSREGLVTLKRLRGSPQDLVDIDRLDGLES